MHVSLISSLAGTLAIAEPNATAIILVVLGVLVAFSVLFSRTIDRMGIPVVLLFIVLGILGGSEGIGKLPFDDYGLAARLGNIALVFILFDGALNTSLSSVRRVLAPAGVLATLGVLLTAAFLAIGGRLIGLGWPEAMLLGAVVSSTDAAAVFAVLRGGSIQLRQRVGRTIEVESCVNDPMAVILTMTLIDAFTTTQTSWFWIILSIPIQLIVGSIIGIGFGLLGRILLRKIRIQTTGLYPALTVSIAFLSFGVATLLWGSGILAVFATGLVLGSSDIPYRNGLARVHDALAWLSQVCVFLMMGLLVFPSQLPGVAWKGLLLALILAFIARPLAVMLCIWPFKFTLNESVYISWVGLRGAVPVILGTFPVLAQVPGALEVFNLVFFVVVISAIIPGSTLRVVTRWLGLTVPDHPQPSAILEMNATHHLNGTLTSFLIDKSVAVCGAQLKDLEIPQGSSVVLIVRGCDLIAPRGQTTLEAGDHVYVFFQPKDRPVMELLFGSPESS